MLGVRQDTNMYTYRYCTLYQDCYEFNKYSVKFINTGTDAVSADQNRKAQLLVQDDEHGLQIVPTQMGAGPTSDPKPRFRTQDEVPGYPDYHLRTRETDLGRPFALHRGAVCRGSFYQYIFRRRQIWKIQ